MEIPPLNHSHSVSFDYLSSRMYREDVCTFASVHLAALLCPSLHPPPNTLTQWRPEITLANPRDHTQERAASCLHEPGEPVPRACVLPVGSQEHRGPNLCSSKRYTEAWQTQIWRRFMFF